MRRFAESADNFSPLSEALRSKVILAIPRLSKAGMPSRSEGWGGLFKDEQYRMKTNVRR